MSSVPDTMSSASNPSPLLRPDDGEQENNTYAQLSVSARGLPADQPDIDLEMASTSTKVDRAFHREVLATDTTREHHVSLGTDGPPGSSQQPRVVLTEVASRGTLNRFAPRQGPIYGMMEIFETRLLSTKSLGSPNFLLSINVKLGSDDHVKVENHLQTLRSHKPIAVLDALFRHNLLFSRAKLYQLFLELRPVVYNSTFEIGAKPTSESTSFRRMDDLRQALADSSSAMEAYRTFRKEPGEIDGDDCIMTLAGMLTEIDKRKSQLKAAQGPDTETADDDTGDVVQSAAEISFLEAKIAHVLVRGAKFSPAGVRTEEESKARLSFLGRLAMAIFGGAALVVPMVSCLSAPPSSPAF